MKRIARLLGWILVIFFAYAVFKSPDQAAAMVRSAWDGLVTALGSITAFFDALLQG